MMTDSHVLARKFRPQTFDQVIGQDAITRTLNNTLKNDRVHHAYLFTGPRGVGKTTTARIFAKALNCRKGVTPEPCGVCDSCQDIAASRSIDVQEIDAATYTKVEDTREVIINPIGIAPARDRYKIFIIDEVHQLSSHSFNALLKTIEEPPPRVVFILATTDQKKVPETILSRCQIFEFRTITLKQIAAQLRSIAGQEGVEISDAALLAIARGSEGSMRDAESALDQVISFSGKTIADDDVSAALGLVDIETLNETLRAIADQDTQRLVRLVEAVVARGYDLRNFCREMMVHIRALLVVKVAGFDAELVQLPESEADTLNQLAQSFSEQDLLRFFGILTKTEQDIRNSSQPRFQLEIGLVRLAQARRLYLLEEAISRIEALEARVGGESAKLPAPSQRGPGAPASSRPANYPARSSTAPRPAGGSSGQGKSQARGQVANSAADAASAVSPAAAAASATPALSAAGAKSSPPSEPPPLPDQAYDAELQLPSSTPRETAATPAGKVKGALEAKRKMMIVAALDKGSISIDGDYFRVTYAPADSGCKTEIEARDKRNAIEDACEEVLGRRLTLRVSIAGKPEEPPGAQPKQQARHAAEADPKLRALVDKFHGEIIEVTKPEE